MKENKVILYGVSTYIKENILIHYKLSGCEAILVLLEVSK